MTFDIFGEELYAGDIVAYSNVDDDGEVVLEAYIVTELIDEHTCLGQLLNTKYAGAVLYLTNTTSRATFVTEWEPELDDEEEIEFSPSSDFN